MIKKLLIALGIGGLAVGGMVAVGGDTAQPEFAAIQWERPKTDNEWKEDVKNEQLNSRHDFQLEQMRASLSEKVPRMLENLTELENFPDYQIHQLEKSGVENPLQMYEDNLKNTREDYERTKRSLERIEKEIELRATKKVDRDLDILKTTPSTPEEKEELTKLKTKHEKTDI